MTPILINGPAIEPVSLTEAKNWLRIDHPDDDALIQTLITSARLVIEAHAQVLIITQSWRLVLDCWPDVPTIVIPLRPLISFDAVRVRDATSVPQVIPIEDYVADTTPQNPRLLFSKAPPKPGLQLAGIEIDVTIGFGVNAGDVPEPLHQAIQMLLARWYENRGDAGTDARTLPADISALVSPWRSARLI